MSREWKPGDVAMVTMPSGRKHLALRVGWPADDWISATEGGVYGATSIRPLVVIDPAEIPHLDDFYNGNPCAALNIIADDVRDIGQGDLDATEQIIRWLAEQMPTTPCATCLDKPLAGFTCNTCGNGADS